jgi:c-di-GMP phosphodiesterase
MVKTGKTMSGNIAKITIREGLNRRIKTVVIGSEEKPDISPEILESWKSLVNMAAKIVDVPSALIMRLHQSEIEVLMGNQDKNSPYKPGDRERLNHGLYCETVVGTQKELLVPDATKDPAWSTDNPDIPLGMISYLGLPLNWPDGEVFGTICLLDKKHNPFSSTYKEFLFSLRQYIEDDLKRLIMDQQLKRTNEEMQVLNMQKTLFLSMISHDIRGGLGTSNEMLKLLSANFDEYEKPRIKKLLQTVSQHIGTTYTTLVDLLLWSRTGMLELKPHKQTLDLTGVLDQALEFFQPMADRKQLQMVKEFDPARPAVSADENMLKAILRNVLSNAIKYSDPGGRLTLRVMAKGAHSVVEIEDEGSGMDEETLTRLFSGSVTAASLEGVESSAGLGLWIAKDFLDMHNARTEIESEPDKGTVFRMIF